MKKVRLEEEKRFEEVREDDHRVDVTRSIHSLIHSKTK